MAIKATLTLRRALWHENASRRGVIAALDLTAAELESEILANIDESVPAGRLRRVGSITGRHTASGVGNRKRGTSSRSVIGSVLHRSSAPGQPPAILSGKLRRAIRVRRINERSIKASVNVKYARYLDNPNILNRPFLRSVARAYFKSGRFRLRVKEKVLGNGA